MLYCDERRNGKQGLAITMMLVTALNIRCNKSECFYLLLVAHVQFTECLHRAT